MGNIGIREVIGMRSRQLLLNARLEQGCFLDC